MTAAWMADLPDDHPAKQLDDDSAFTAADFAQLENSVTSTEELDPKMLDHFEAVDDQVCPEIIAVTTIGQTLQLRCEVEGPHDEHEATLRWATEPPEEERDG